MTNVERKWEHRRDVKRRQLQEREQNLFKFSLVDILEVQGEMDEAIDILRAIPDIINAPNGYYYEQEPGHTLSWEVFPRRKSNLIRNGSAGANVPREHCIYHSQKKKISYLSID